MAANRIRLAAKQDLVFAQSLRFIAGWNKTDQVGHRCCTTGKGRNMNAAPARTVNTSETKPTPTLRGRNPAGLTDAVGRLGF